MRWIITDSGLGGLSVCARMEQELTKSQSGSGIELLYVNATPSDLGGYNSLSTQSARIDLFDRFLKAVNSRFSPDQIAIACNTLSVIYAETNFSKESPITVKGIVDAGVQLCNASLVQEPQRDLIIFATETTTEANTYPSLIQNGSAQLVAQACPELANAISNDPSGAACRRLLKIYVKDALGQFQGSVESVSAFLGCTHYGYQAQIFCEELAAQGVEAKALIPNDLLVDQLLESDALNNIDSADELKIRFISRYPIPQTQIEAMDHYLSNSAPLTMAALHKQEVIPDLF